MPIQVNNLETQVDVETRGAAEDGPQLHSGPQSAERLQESARRDAQLAQRTAAWGFDD